MGRGVNSDYHWNTVPTFCHKEEHTALVSEQQQLLSINVNILMKLDAHCRIICEWKWLLCIIQAVAPHLSFFALILVFVWGWSSSDVWVRNPLFLFLCSASSTFMLSEKNRNCKYYVQNKIQFLIKTFYYNAITFQKSSCTLFCIIFGLDLEGN